MFMQAHIQLLDSLCPGFVNSSSTTTILDNLGIRPHFLNVPKIQTVIWYPPMRPWIKVYTDGLSKGKPNLAASGGVFRNHVGEFIGYFTIPLGHQTSFYSEIYAIILVIEIAYSKGCKFLWPESDF